MIVSQAVLKRFDLDLFKHREWKGLDDVSEMHFAPPSIITLQIYIEERPQAPRGGNTGAKFKKAPPPAASSLFLVTPN